MLPQLNADIYKMFFYGNFKTFCFKFYVLLTVHLHIIV